MRLPDWLPARLAPAARRWPGPSYALAAVADGLRDSVGLVPRPSERTTRIRERASGRPFRPRFTGYRDWVVDVRRHDPGIAAPYPKLVCSPPVDSLHGPSVLVSFHIGAMVGLSAFLEQLDAEVLLLRTKAARAPRVPTIGVRGADEWQRAQTAKRAVGVLESGGFVLLAVDGLANSYVAYEVLGRTVSADSSAFALARLGRAPLVPLIARWRRTRLEITAGEPIAPGDPAIMAAAVGEWLGRYVRDHPRELRWPLTDLRKLGPRWLPFR